MEVRARHRNARIAPRKLRSYRGMLTGLSVAEADAQLKFMSGLAPTILRQVLQSAVANAQHNFEIAADALRVADVVIDGGFVMKRFRPVSKGRAHSILKRTSHVTVVVEEVVQAGETPRQRPKKTTDIQELTAADVISGQLSEAPDEAVTTPSGTGGSGGVATAEHSKQEEAYQRMKMQQQGGDPKKSHRRKSLGN